MAALFHLQLAVVLLLQSWCTAILMGGTTENDEERENTWDREDGEDIWDHRSVHINPPAHTDSEKEQEDTWDEEDAWDGEDT